MPPEGAQAICLITATGWGFSSTGPFAFVRRFEIFTRIEPDYLRKLFKNCKIRARNYTQPLFPCMTQAPLCCHFATGNGARNLANTPSGV
jgi:hypothetical protein